MNTIKIRKHTPAQLKFYGPDDKFIGFVNNKVEILCLRLDVAKQQTTGYYFMYGSQRINILPNGDIDNWPDGLYDDSYNLTIELIKIREDIESK